MRVPRNSAGMSGRLGRRPAGVTLIELMIVLIIVGVLSAVAVPAWRSYTLRAHRTEAKSALLRLAVNQERWYLQHNVYADDPVQLGFPDSLSENGVYSLDFVGIPGTTGFTARATAVAGGGRNGVDQSNDLDCVWFTINEQGRRDAGPDPTDTCW